jgi:hypothetical protein
MWGTHRFLKSKRQKRQFTNVVFTFFFQIMILFAVSCVDCNFLSSVDSSTYYHIHNVILKGKIYDAVKGT